MSGSLVVSQVQAATFKMKLLLRGGVGVGQKEKNTLVNYINSLPVLGSDGLPSQFLKLT